MKKLLLSMVAVAAISLASCGNKNTTAAPANDSDTPAAMDSAAADTAAADTAMVK